MEEKELEEKAEFIRNHDYLVKYLNFDGEEIVDKEKYEQQMNKFTFLNK